jgi:hypothetical protein
MNKWYLFLFAAAIFLSACNSNDQRNLNIDLKEINIPPVEIHRYEKALFSIPKDSLQAGLKAIADKFPIFLSADLDDTLNIIQLHQFVNNPLNTMLYDSTLAKFPNLRSQEVSLTNAFKRFKYYFPEKQVPDVFSYVSGLLYETPIQFFNDDMIIALDMYLGTELKEYRSLRLPLYQIQKMNADYLVRDAMFNLYYYHFLEKPGKDFLEQMISKGKHLYFLDAMLPETADYIKIGYPEQKLDWCVANEANIWAFLIQNDLLYSSDSQTIRKFFVDGPFTSEFTDQSPARMGEWIGWQVVRTYMNNNPHLSLEQLMNEQDSQKVLKNSGYKPRS